MPGPSIFLLAGEPSGDRHAGALALELRRQDSAVRLRGIGGPAMRDAGVELLHTIDEFSVLGFSEVIGRLPFFFRVLGELGTLFRRERPDLFLPIDFPDFNLRAAGRAKAAGVPVLWYISPQIWAWRAGRMAALRRVVDQMMVVFPFEVELYRRAGVPVEFVGHPLLEPTAAGRETAAVRSALGVGGERPLVALLPGSRAQEVARILPPLAEAARRLSEAGRADAAVSRAPGVAPALYDAALRRAGATLPFWDGPAVELARAADLAVVASGTATLETGLTGTPLIVVYRMGKLNWEIARRLVKLPQIGLVNIAAGQPIAPELLQQQVTGAGVAGAITSLLLDAPRLAAMRAALAELPRRLMGPGASRRTAERALEIAGAGRR